MSPPPLASMNLNLLVSLSALLEERSVTRAARRVGLSQPAMSHNLAALREQLADPLLVRTQAGMELTPRGAQLRSPLVACLQELERVLGEGDDFAPGDAEGTVTIATGEHLAASFGPRLLATLSREAPRLEVRFEALKTAQAAEHVREVDLALGPAALVGSGVEGTTLPSDPYCCLLPAGAMGETRRPRLTLSRYLKLPHVLISPTGRGVSPVDAALGRLGHRRHVLARTSSFLVAPHLVLESGAVLTAPTSVFSVASRGLPLMKCAPPKELELTPLRLALMWDARRSATPRNRWLRGVVRDHVAVNAL